MFEVISFDGTSSFKRIRGFFRTFSLFKGYIPHLLNASDIENVVQLDCMASMQQNIVLYLSFSLEFGPNPFILLEFQVILMKTVVSIEYFVFLWFFVDYEP